MGLAAGWIGLIGGVAIAAVLSWALGRSAARGDELNDRAWREQRARERDEQAVRQRRERERRLRADLDAVRRSWDD